MTPIGMIIVGFMCTVVVVPAALIGALYKKTDPHAQARANKAALVASVIAFLLHDDASGITPGNRGKAFLRANKPLDWVRPCIGVQEIADQKLILIRGLRRHPSPAMPNTPRPRGSA
jgi:hypothetical protein